MNFEEISNYLEFYIDGELAKHNQILNLYKLLEERKDYIVLVINKLLEKVANDGHPFYIVDYNNVYTCNNIIKGVVNRYGGIRDDFLNDIRYLSNGILNNIVTIKIYINSELKGLPEIENLSIVYDCEHLAFTPEIDYEEKYFKIFRIKEEAIKDVKSFLVKTIEKYNEKQLNKLKNAFDIIAERAEFMSNIIVTSNK